MATNNAFPVLKTKYLEVERDSSSEILIQFVAPYILVGVICPEVSSVVEDQFNRVNLKPYELACQKFSNSDYQYDKLQVSPAGSRTLKSLGIIFSGTYNYDGMCPLIVSYLEFKDL